MEYINISVHPENPSEIYNILDYFYDTISVIGKEFWETKCVEKLKDKNGNTISIVGLKWLIHFTLNDNHTKILIKIRIPEENQDESIKMFLEKVCYELDLNDEKDLSLFNKDIISKNRPCNILMCMVKIDCPSYRIERDFHLIDEYLRSYNVKNRIDGFTFDFIGVKYDDKPVLFFELYSKDKSIVYSSKEITGLLENQLLFVFSHIAKEIINYDFRSAYSFMELILRDDKENKTQINIDHEKFHNLILEVVKNSKYSCEDAIKYFTE